jgi:hypothetical protein
MKRKMTSKAKKKTNLGKKDIGDKAKKGRGAIERRLEGKEM